MVLGTKNKFIKYVSSIYHGAQHDYRIFKSEFPPNQQRWLSEFELHLDLGYYGIEKDYPELKISIPHKKPKKRELSQTQKIENKGKSSIRIVVENAIGGMKRYRFLTDRLRCRDKALYSKVAGLAAGLWNFNLTH